MIFSPMVNNMSILSELIDFFKKSADFWYFIGFIVLASFLYALLYYLWVTGKEKYPLMKLFLAGGIVLPVSFFLLSPIYFLGVIVVAVVLGAWILYEKRNINRDASEILNAISLMEKHIDSITDAKESGGLIGEYFGNNIKYYQVFGENVDGKRFSFASCAEGVGYYKGFLLRSFYNVYTDKIEKKRIVWWRDGAGWRAKTLYHSIRTMCPTIEDKRLMVEYMEYNGESF